MMSRGCPYSCTYCCNHKIREVYPNPHKYARFRSPDRSIEYLKKILNDYSFIEYISFMDNILPMRRSWFYEFIDLYKREIGLPFACNFRANLVKEDVVKALKDAGCFRIHFGVESGDDFIRNTILKRNISRQDMVDAFDACREAGISTLSYNMVGLPYEDINKALETVKLNAEMKTKRVVVSIFYPYPNTEAYAMSVKEGFIEPSFDYRDDVPLTQEKFKKDAVVFVSTYFETFIRLYRFAERLPSGLAKRMERALDKIFCSRLLPHAILVKAARLRDRYIQKAKAKLKERSPNFYLFLRDRLLRANK
jgi:anaerobic magnesium-protoporphyrin IX monomethyl ester cyclase